MKRAVTALALMLLAGAAPAGVFDDEEARKGVEQAKKDIAQVQSGVKALDARIARIEEGLKSQSVLDLLNQIEALKQEIAKLRGQVEELRFAEESSQKRQKDFYVDLEFTEDGNWKVLRANGEVYSAEEPLAALVDYEGNALLAARSATWRSLLPA